MTFQMRAEPMQEKCPKSPLPSRTSPSTSTRSPTPPDVSFDKEVSNDNQLNSLSGTSSPSQVPLKCSTITPFSVKLNAEKINTIREIRSQDSSPLSVIQPIGRMTPVICRNVAYQSPSSMSAGRQSSLEPLVKRQKVNDTGQTSDKKIVNSDNDLPEINRPNSQNCAETEINNTRNGYETSEDTMVDVNENILDNSSNPTTKPKENAQLHLQHVSQKKEDSSDILAKACHAIGLDTDSIDLSELPEIVQPTSPSSIPRYQHPHHYPQSHRYHYPYPYAHHAYYAHPYRGTRYHHQQIYAPQSAQSYDHRRESTSIRKENTLNYKDYPYHTQPVSSYPVPYPHNQPVTQQYPSNPAIVRETSRPNLTNMQMHSQGNRGYYYNYNPGTHPYAHQGSKGYPSRSPYYYHTQPSQQPYRYQMSGAEGRIPRTPTNTLLPPYNSCRYATQSYHRNVVQSSGIYSPPQAQIGTNPHNTKSNLLSSTKPSVYNQDFQASKTRTEYETISSPISTSLGTISQAEFNRNVSRNPNANVNCPSSNGVIPPSNQKYYNTDVSATIYHKHNPAAVNVQHTTVPVTNHQQNIAIPNGYSQSGDREKLYSETHPSLQRLPRCFSEDICRSSDYLSSFPDRNSETQESLRQRERSYSYPGPVTCQQSGSAIRNQSNGSTPRIFDSNIPGVPNNATSPLSYNGEAMQQDSRSGHNVPNVQLIPLTSATMTKNISQSSSISAAAQNTNHNNYSSVNSNEVNNSPNQRSLSSSPAQKSSCKYSSSSSMFMSITEADTNQNAQSHSPDLSNAIIDYCQEEREVSEKSPESSIPPQRTLSMQYYQQGNNTSTYTNAHSITQNQVCLSRESLTKEWIPQNINEREPSHEINLSDIRYHNMPSAEFSMSQRAASEPLTGHFNPVDEARRPYSHSGEFTTSDDTSGGEIPTDYLPRFGKNDKQCPSRDLTESVMNICDISTEDDPQFMADSLPSIQSCDQSTPSDIFLLDEPEVSSSLIPDEEDTSSSHFSEPKLKPDGETDPKLSIHSATSEVDEVTNFKKKLLPVLDHLLSVPEAETLRHLRDSPEELLTYIVKLWGGQEYAPSEATDAGQRLKENFLTMVKLLFKPHLVVNWGWEHAAPDQILEDLMKPSKVNGRNFLSLAATYLQNKLFAPRRNAETSCSIPTQSESSICTVSESFQTHSSENECILDSAYSNHFLKDVRVVLQRISDTDVHMTSGTNRDNNDYKCRPTNTSESTDIHQSNEKVICDTLNSDILVKDEEISISIAENNDIGDDFLDSYNHLIHQKSRWLYSIPETNNLSENCASTSIPKESGHMRLTIKRRRLSDPMKQKKKKKSDSNKISRTLSFNPPMQNVSNNEPIVDSEEVGHECDESNISVGYCKENFKDDIETKNSDFICKRNAAREDVVQPAI